MNIEKKKCFLYVVYIANEANQAFEPCKIMHKIISYFFCLDNPFVQVLNVVVVVKDNIRCKKRYYLLLELIKKTITLQQIIYGVGANVCP